ncbi:MAG TPA: hypothetical protein DHD79_08780 [Firmicutes bacterium]|nr:hypothetical protein [Bacillota bacterium]HAZ22602.1 hypothetical protein [Bacillota bacterium]HBE05103.1 hypothetical protein [Bacillota bacterium]HBG43866.1 hypothetical protein [Bacillota bacterium]HBL49252.1 hypothetical protein [Bacillota bacterium]
MNNRRLTGLLTVILIACLLSISGCKRTYDLAIGVEGIGTVAPTRGIHQYERGIPITMKVVPAQGWGFAGWGGPHGKTVVRNTIIMDQNKYVTAVFQKLQHQLDISVTPKGAGTVDVVIVPAPKVAAIEDGQTVRLIAVPNAGYAFDCWDDDPECSSPTLEFMMDAPKSVRATFVAQVAAPEFTKAQGTYGYGLEVGLSCATPDAQIYYTTDGITTPSTTEGTLYDGTPLQLTQSTVIKAVAHKAGLVDSAVVTRVYTIKALTLVADLASGTYDCSVSVSLSTAADNMTIRYTLDGSAPTATHGTLYNGPVAIDQTLTLKAVAYSENVASSDVLIRDYVLLVSKKAPMPTPRKGLAAVAVGGKVYAIGGMNHTGILDTVEAYDPSTNTWETKASMPTARTYLAAVAVDGYIYAFGGRTASADRTKTVQRYDPQTDTWDVKPDGPQGMVLCTAVAVNGKVHIAVGGYSNPGNAPFYTGHLIYDPMTDTWEERLISTHAVGEYFYGAAAAVVDQDIYYFGGIYFAAYSSDYMRKYNVLSQIWSYETSLPYFCQYAAAADIDNNIFLIGGARYSSDYLEQRYNTISCYDTQTDTWGATVTMPTARYLHAAAVIGDRIYIVGGETADGVLAVDVLEYKPE